MWLQHSRGEEGTILNAENRGEEESARRDMFTTTAYTAEKGSHRTQITGKGKIQKIPPVLKGCVDQLFREGKAIKS